MRVYIFIFFCCLIKPILSENRTLIIYCLDSKEQLIDSKTIDFKEFERISQMNQKPNPIFQHFRKKQKLNKKFTAAVLAFPFPFGIVGLHRIYLGTKPHVPVAYIASLGGVFGILPLIDCLVIIFDKDIEPYKDNGKVFMWLKN